MRLVRLGPWSAIDLDEVIYFSDGGALFRDGRDTALTVIQAAALADAVAVAQEPPDAGLQERFDKLLEAAQDVCCADSDDEAQAMWESLVEVVKEVNDGTD